MKKKVSLLLAMAMVLSLAACGTPKAPAGDANTSAPGVTSATADSTTPAGGKILKFALQNEPDLLDPNVTSNSFASPFLVNLFEGLVTYDSENNLIPGNAEKWDISADGLTYTFTLRDNLKWSDGSPLTSADYLYTMKRILTPATTAQYLTMMTDYVVNAQEYYDGKVTIEELGIKTPDPKTLVITLKAPAPFFLGILSMYTFSPTKESVVTAEPEKWAQSATNYISNGPFLMSEYNFGKSIVLAKNPNYWDAANVAIDGIEFRYILDASTALSVFESGEIDGMRSIPPADMPRLKTESDALQVVPSYGSTYYLYNNQNEVLKDVKVRKALALAIDRTSLIEDVLQTTDSPAFALVSPGYTVDGKDYVDGRSDFGLSAKANVEEAKKLLAEAGYPEGKGFPKLRLGYYSDTTIKKVTEALQQMWKANLGIDLEITVADWAVFYAGVQKGDFDVAAMGWGADYLHPMTFYPLFVTNDPTNNAVYSNPAYDKLVQQARTITDPAEAVTVMRQAEELLMADMPFCPLYYRTISLLMRPEVTDWFMSPLNALYLKGTKIAG